MTKSIKARTRRLAQESCVTGSNLRLGYMTLGFPVEISGLKIVGIGTGISSTTKELRDWRVEAFAVDHRYTSLADIKNGLSKDGIGRKELEEFIGDYEKHRERYIPALVGAERLPFEDSSVDIVYSEKCLSTVLLDDFDVFLSAFQEILRILKPYQSPLKSGLLLIHPWVGGISMSTVNPVNALAFHEHLQHNTQAVGQVERLEDKYLPSRLIVVKLPSIKS